MKSVLFAFCRAGLQFVDLRLDVKKLNALKDAKNQARNAIEKTQKPNIFVQKEEKRRTGYGKKISLQPAAALGLRLEKRRRQLVPSRAAAMILQPDSRFPVGILIMFADVARERFDVVVQKRMFESCRLPVDHDVLVDLHICHGNILLAQAALVTAFAAAKER